MAELKKLNYSYILILIFVVVFVSRLIISGGTGGFSDPESYNTLRQIENIKENGLLIYNDDLSYGGREIIVLPFFYYLATFFSLFSTSIIAGKVLINLLGALTVIPVFLITRKITKNNKVSLFISFISGFIPIYFALTINSFTEMTLFIPVIFMFIYFFMGLEKKRDLYMLLISFFIILITTPNAVLIIIGLFFYLLLVKIEMVGQAREEIELILFLTFITFWAMFMLYKDFFLFHGAAIIWKNIPVELLNQFFISLDIPILIIKIGVLPFIFGLYVVYDYIFKRKDKDMYLLVSFAISIIILVWLNLLEFNLGIILLSIFLTIFFGKFFDTFLQYIEKTRVSRFYNFIILAFLIIFIFNSLIPSYTFAQDEIGKSFQDEEVDAYLWIEENTPKNSVIITSTEEGALVSYYSKRRNIIDTNFLLIPHINERYFDVSQIYRTLLLTEAINLINKYNGDYIMLSPRAKKEFQVEILKYVEDDCFRLVYDSEIMIYKSLCEVK